MIYLIKPPSGSHDTSIQIQLPTSKSISNRLLVMAALSDEESDLVNLSDCDDTHVMLQAFQNDPEVVDIGAAGTSMRFLTAYYAMTDGKTHVLTGTERMKQRPIKILVDALRQLGADITYLESEGCPPLRIVGKKLQGGSLVVEGSISSQYISALLMIAPYLEQGLQLTLSGHIASRPYIDMTLSLMRRFGVDADWSSHATITVKPGTYTIHKCVVERDWSAASYWYEYLLLTRLSLRRKWPRSLCIPGLDSPQHSLQGDSVIHELCSTYLVGVHYDELDSELFATLEKMCPSCLRQDFSEIPDLAQTVVVAMCMLGVPFIFNGLESLYIKETDRVHALKTELAKLGYILHDDGKGMLMWQQGRCPAQKKPVIQTYKDHRMAMAFAFCCMLLGEIRIADPGVVSKSYPTFWDDLRQVGFTIEEQEEEVSC